MASVYEDGQYHIYTSSNWELCGFWTPYSAPCAHSVLRAEGSYPLVDPAAFLGQKGSLTESVADRPCPARRSAFARCGCRHLHGRPFPSQSSQPFRFTFTTSCYQFGRAGSLDRTLSLRFLWITNDFRQCSSPTETISPVSIWSPRSPPKLLLSAACMWCSGWVSGGYPSYSLCPPRGPGRARSLTGAPCARSKELPYLLEFQKC